MSKHGVNLATAVANVGKNIAFAVFFPRQALPSYVNKSVSAKYQKSFAKRMLDNVRAYII